jgi:glutamate synthase domain-containing protein 3
MSGGVAYVFDPDRRFEQYCNLSMVAIEPVMGTAEQLEKTEPATWHRGECDEIILKGLIEKHFRLTGSQIARSVLDQWDRSRGHFVKVFPHEYRKALAAKAPARQSMAARAPA